MRRPQPRQLRRVPGNPFPNLPEVLMLKNGQKVTTPEIWWKQRRPEIVEDFEREVYGRTPKNVPKVTWEVKVTDHEWVGFTPVIARQLVGHVDNSAYPQIAVDISMTVVLPANHKGPMPVLMMFGRAALPNPTQPPPEDMEKNQCSGEGDAGRERPSMAEIFKRYPGYSPLTRWRLRSDLVRRVRQATRRRLSS